MYRNILVAIDSSADSGAAVDAAIWMAKGLKGAIHGVHVVDPSLYELSVAPDLGGGLGFEPTYQVSEEVRKLLEEEAGRLLEAFEIRCRAEGLACRSIRERGRVADGIGDALRSSDLLVMGARSGEKGSGKPSIGASAEAMVRSSFLPVLVVPSPFRPVARPMLAWDGSGRASRALLRAANFCERLALPLKVVTVEEEGEGARLISEVATYLEPYGVKATPIIRSGDPRKEIRAAAAEGADLLFVGSHGRGRIRELLLGSTTEAILAESDIPVLCCV